MKKYKIEVTAFQLQLIHGLRVRDTSITDSEALQTIINYACENPVFEEYYVSKVGHIGWGYRRGH